jgi:hypothetical protein
MIRAIDGRITPAIIEEMVPMISKALSVHSRLWKNFEIGIVAGP